MFESMKSISYDVEAINAGVKLSYWVIETEN